MSFGFSVGDVIAVLNLFERVAVEVRNYRDAPRHFQQLGAELQLLCTTIQRLLQIQPGDNEEKRQLEHIRAIAMHCRQPLLAFINKMRPSETSLGPSRSAATLGSIGRRLHWSMITRNDVDELRKMITAEMTAINLLLGLQQMSSLKKLTLQTEQGMSQELKRFRAQSDIFITNSEAVYEKLEKLPEDITTLQTMMARQQLKQEEFTTSANADFQAISSNSKALVQQGNIMTDAIRSLGDRMSQTIDVLMSIAMDVRQILSWLKRFSKDFSDKIATNGKMLLDIHAMMKRLVRAVESIPLHLTLAIVRLDDALGESWALPFQACLTQYDFHNILETVVFGGNRRGSALVHLNQYIVRCAKSGKILKEESWNAFIKQGAHLSQAVTMYETRSSARQCPFIGCNGSLKDKSKVCPKCGKESSFQPATATGIQINTTYRSQSAVPKDAPRQSAFVPRTSLNSLEMNDFRNIHFVERRKNPVKTHSQATGILEQEPSDPSALQYMGWWNLCDTFGHTEDAVSYLTRSVESDPDCMESHYLLGRAFMDRQPPEPSRAYEAYQLASYRGMEANSTFWVSVGILFFHNNQYRDCYDVFSRSIRLNPYEALAWRNLGILYDHCYQHADACDAYTQALDLGPLDDECLDRRNALQSSLQFGTPAPPLTIKMKDFDLHYATYDAYETGGDHSVNIPELHLDRVR